ncbi:unnamed protein product, partial [Cladocopium goreaui]
DSKFEGVNSHRRLLLMVHLLDASSPSLQALGSRTIFDCSTSYIAAHQDFQDFRCRFGAGTAPSGAELAVPENLVKDVMQKASHLQLAEVGKTVFIKATMGGGLRRAKDAALPLEALKPMEDQKRLVLNHQLLLVAMACCWLHLHPRNHPYDSQARCFSWRKARNGESEMKFSGQCQATGL